MSQIPNMLSYLKNAQLSGHEEVVLPFSRMKFEVAQILKREKFIGEIEKIKRKNHVAELPFLKIRLVYHDGKGAIHGVHLLSKSSRHVYAHADELRQIKSGHGVAIVSTSKGIMTNQEARKAGIGGEVLFEIW